MTTGSYMLAPALQQIFINKDTQELLANGKVYFYKDDARTTLKPVYQQTGSPPNYDFTALPNPVILNASASPQNAAGQQVEIYYFPFDDSGVIEKYYIEVYSSDDVLQFTVEGFPDVTASSADSSISENFIANGQFLAHTDIPADPENNLEAGEIRAAETDIAWGGFKFIRDASTTAKDIVLFETFGPGITDPAKNPRFSIRVECEEKGSGETEKDIRIRFNDVNRFASATDEFTFGFTGIANAGGSETVTAYIYKNFGTSAPGGPTPSPDGWTAIPNGSFTLGNAWSTEQVAFTFGENTGKTLGNNNDDYVELVLRMPLNTTFDVSFSDFLLAEGNLATPIFPYTSDRQTIAQSLGGGFPIPNPDGSDLFLPAILTKEGWQFDYSQIGKIYYATYKDLTLPNQALRHGELLCNGDSYLTNAYSNEGIPYARLQSVLVDGDATGMPKYGTGTDYMSSLILESTPSTVQAFNNTGGSVAAAADTGGTTFTISTINTPAKDSYFVTAYLFDSTLIEENKILLKMDNKSTSVAAAVNAHTSGFTVANYQAYGSSAGLRHRYFTITTVDTSGMSGGEYWSFTSINDSDAAENYYMWFKVDGAGADPAPAGTWEASIEVDLLSTDTAKDVAIKVQEATNAYQITTIECKDASAIPQSSYFEINTRDGGETKEFYVWFNKDGSGVDPAVAGKTGIEVQINSADVATDIATNMLATMNSYSFRVPDLRGKFMRVWNDGSTIDPEANLRFSLVPGVIGDVLGTDQLDELLSHNHVFTTIQTQNSGGNSVNRGDAADNPSTQGTTSQGGPESRPYNTNVLAVIKY